MQQTVPASLYDEDYALWVAEQVNALHAAAHEGRLQNVDVENVIEELEGLARRDRSKLLSHLTVVAMHLLKFQIQPSRATRSWLVSINNSATKIRKLLTQSPSMANLLPAYITEAYADARREASVETGVPIANVPTQMSASFGEELKAALRFEDFGGEAVVNQNQSRALAAAAE